MRKKKGKLKRKRTEELKENRVEKDNINEAIFGVCILISVYLIT